MKNKLDKVLMHMKNKYSSNILDGGRNYMEADIGKEAEELGFAELKDTLRHVYAVIPLKEAAPGMKVRIDGRTFVNYVQFESGIAVPGYIVKHTKLPYKSYIPQDSMICNFA